MNWRFVGRGLLVGLAAIGLLAAGLYGLLFPALPYGPVPEAPVFDRPPGALPPAGVGLPVWAEYRDREPVLAGSGFFLALPDGQIIGVTAAHSFQLENGLLGIGFGPNAQSTGAPAGTQPGGAQLTARLDTLHGEPGRARLLGNRLTGDYLLLSVPPGAAEGLSIGADLRGGPQAGERIVLYSGVLEAPQEGAVFRSDGAGAWAIMDEMFDPALSSGSPVLSQHSGLVVGMALAAGRREGQLVLGMHPIGSIVQQGLAAERLIPLAQLP